MLNRKSVITFTMLLSLSLGGTALAQSPAGDGPASPMGKCTPEQLTGAARNCPALNGSLPRDAAPGLGAYTPEQLAKAAENCPGINGRSNGHMDAQSQFAAQADARMRRIAKALEGNKRTSDILLGAAAEAGVEPHVLDDMKHLSQAFREMFMAAVPPQQILESLLSTPQAAGQGGIIITAPDGSQWLVTPQTQPNEPLPPMGRQPRMDKAPAPGAAPAPQARQRGLLPPAEVLQDPALRAAPQTSGAKQPPAPAINTPRPNRPQAQPKGQQMEAAPGAEIIYNETLPYWPTREHLGKEGLLKYLEKYRAAQ